MPTKKKASRKGHGPKQDGSPIKVGGGAGIGKGGPRKNTTGVACTFRHGAAHYPDPDPHGNPGTKIFKHPGWYMRTLKLKLSEGTLDFGARLADGQNKVKITCNGSGTDFTIDDRDDDDGLGVEFHTGKFPQVTAEPDSAHYRATYIKKVEIDVKQPPYKFSQSFGEDDAPEVYVNYR